MAKFYIKGKRKRILHIEIIEDIEGDFSITKAEVMDKTGCPAKQDGDSTIWYEYVEEAVKWVRIKATPISMRLNKQRIPLSKSFPNT